VNLKEQVMFFSRKPLDLPTAADALPGRAAPLRRCLVGWFVGAGAGASNNSATRNPRAAARSAMLAWQLKQCIRTAPPWSPRPVGRQVTDSDGL